MPETKRIGEIAKKCGVYGEWLLTGDGPMARGDASASPPPHTLAGMTPIIEWETPEDLPPDHYVFIQQRKVRPSAGRGSLVFDEEQGPPLAFTTKWVKQLGAKHKDLVVVEAAGDSMEPGIHDGDAIMVDLGETDIIDGSVYVIRYRDELRVKRLFRRYDGALIIRSDNSAKYPEETIPPQDLDGQVEVIGRVVWRAGGVA